MKINILEPPDPDIFRDRKKYIIWFAFFMVMACVGIGVGVFAIYFDTHHYRNLDNWALGILVGSSLGITRFGNRLQEYKRLYPPQLKKLRELQAENGQIKKYCEEIGAAERREIRAEYDACVEFAEKHPGGVPFN